MFDVCESRVSMIGIIFILGIALLTVFVMIFGLSVREVVPVVHGHLHRALYGTEV